MEGYRREVDIFVAGVDTGGTVTGIGEYLKSQNPNVKVVAVGPAGSPVLSKRTAGPHKIQDIKPNTIRLSIGTENVKDLIAALDKAFKSIE